MPRITAAASASANFNHETDMQRAPLGNTGLEIPRLVFGTSTLGNLFRVIPEETKMAIVSAWVDGSDGYLMVDTAGKYGAGLALQTIAAGLSARQVPPENVLVSNKLGWRRAPLTTPEPTFEPGAWFGLEYDAVQDINYDGILRCWEEGNQLLGDYKSTMVSVHDPDEYLAAAASPGDRDDRWRDITSAYRALHELKQNGQAKAVGVGAKDWRVIQQLAGEVQLDWVMLANSYTIYRRPPQLAAFMQQLQDRGVGIINSALLHSGYLSGGEFFDYRKIDPQTSEGQQLNAWRDAFQQLCQQWQVDLVTACLQYGFKAPSVTAIATSSGKPSRIGQHIEMLQTQIPAGFWQAFEASGL